MLSSMIRARILPSRDMKFAALTSSSTRIAEAPISIASTTLAACDVEPDASLVEKCFVSDPTIGKFDINALTLVLLTYRPSSARTVNAFSSVTQSSLPSPRILLYTPVMIVRSIVDLPWYPPPTIRVIPFGMIMPLTVILVLSSLSLPPAALALVVVLQRETFGFLTYFANLPISTVTSFARLLLPPLGASNGIAGGVDIGAKLAPLFLGKILPLAINAIASSDDDDNDMRILFCNTTFAIWGIKKWSWSSLSFSVLFKIVAVMSSK
mmetsp:Transcript_24394/g.36366  ORF Transcript_24394/g.36366 Transcript_24394/m.36366 type:complete len:267 (-) Transcript_24394:325-1125(-)